MFLIYSFYKKMQRRNSNKKIWFIENNVESHQKISKMTQKYKNENDIFIVEWFFNSFYIHSIENVWNFFKSRLQFTWKEIREFSTKVKFKAHKIINDVWHSNFLLMKTKKAMLNWRNKLLKCIEHDEYFNFKN